MMFHVESLAFGYNGKQVIEDISLELSLGRFYGILGPNGSGKSTFMDLLTGRLAPRTGRITYKDRNLNTYSRRELARELALVPQNFHINFPYTAHEVVMMGRYPRMPRFSPPSAEDLAAVDRAMARAGIADFKQRYLTEMSGGERQRVIIARALAQDTPVLLLDEATANLDIRHALKVLDEVAADVKSGRLTAVAVFQDINLAAAYCDILIFFKDGRLAGHGPTETVLTEGMLRTVFGVNAAVNYDTETRSLQVRFRRNDQTPSQTTTH